MAWFETSDSTRNSNNDGFIGLPFAIQVNVDEHRPRGGGSANMIEADVGSGC